MGHDGGLGSEQTAVFLHHGNVVRWKPKRGKLPHQVGRGKNRMGQIMGLRGRQRAGHQRAVGRADFGDSRDLEQSVSSRGLKLTPQAVGAPQQRHVGGVLEIPQADDSRRPVGRPAFVARHEAIQPDDALAPAGQMPDRCAAHRPQADHDNVESLHWLVGSRSTSTIS